MLYEVITSNSKIHSSVLLDGAFIGERVSCNEAIICENARLLRGSAVFEYAVVGENAIIGEGSTVEAGVKVWQGKQLDRNTTASYDIKYGNSKSICLDDEGVCGETNGVITPQIASILGSSLASSCDSENCIVGIGYKGGRITSYNVCYTKLLRMIFRLSLHKLESEEKALMVGIMVV